MTAFYLSNTQTKDFRLAGAADGKKVLLTPDIPVHIRQVLEQHFFIEEVAAIVLQHPIYGAFQEHVQHSG